MDKNPDMLGTATLAFELEVVPSIRMKVGLMKDKRIKENRWI